MKNVATLVTEKGTEPWIPQQRRLHQQFPYRKIKPGTNPDQPFAKPGEHVEQLTEKGWKKVPYRRVLP